MLWRLKNLQVDITVNTVVRKGDVSVSVIGGSFSNDPYYKVFSIAADLSMCRCGLSSNGMWNAIHGVTLL